MSEPTNPLLDTTALRRFDAIQPAHIAPALDALLGESTAALQRVTAPGFPATWGALAGTLDVATERLGRAWGAVSHLNAVADTPELRAAYNAALPRMTEFFSGLASNEALYAQYKAIDPATLNAEQTQARTNALRGFVLGGAELQGEAKARFNKIQERLAELSQAFGEHVLDATDGYALYAKLEELDGVPADVITAAAQAANASPDPAHHGLYKLTLQMPCYLPVMQFAKHRPLREALYRAFVTRASDQATGDGAAARDNTPVMAEILALRAEEAALLGYPDFATLSLVPKMAPSPDAVESFLLDLAQRARPFAEQDLADLRAFAAEHLNLTDPQAWDWPFIGEKLKEARYAFSEQAVRQYFQAPKVLAGLFAIIERLFDVTIRPDDAPVWHESVQFYRLERKDATGQPQLIGQFYLDLTARAGKRGGAWMDDARTRWLRPDTHELQTPVAYLVCNFASNVDGRPALLSHDDVITLFHEFGHGLHHLLTQVQERDVAGINGVEWDAVELPSQFMENFCWEWSVLQVMTSHIDTGEPLPRELFNKMLAAKNFQSGLQMLRQVEFALFDMRLHRAGMAAQPVNVQAVLDGVRDQVAVMKPPAFSRSAHSFSHIFAGGYAAGYYSYKWAEVLSADAWAAFEDSMQADGLPSPDTGRRFRQTILEVGGSRPAMISFQAFRGREPQIDALLRHSGMAVNAATEGSAVAA